MKPAAGHHRVNATFSLSVVTAAAKQTHADAELAVPQAKKRTCVDPNIATCIWKYGDPSAKNGQSRPAFQGHSLTQVIETDTDRLPTNVP